MNVHTSDSEFGSLVRRVRKVARRFRSAHPLPAPPRNAGSFPLATNYAGAPETKVLAWFPSPGCLYSRHTGCLMCNFGADSGSASIEDSLQIFDRYLDRLDPGVRRLHLGPGGSFFEDAEVPPAMRRGVCGSLARFPFLRSVGVETRPNLVTKARLLETIDALPRQVRELTLGIGFECVTDLVREVTINKGYGRQHVKRAVEIINAVNSERKNIRVDFEIYVLLKPLFLSEMEGIDEAIRTIDWAYAQGADTAVLFMNTVKSSTIQAYLASRSDLEPPLRYQPPYYRSAVQVLRSLPPDQRRRTQILGVQSGVEAHGMPRGCSLCTAFLLGAVMAHNFTRDPAVLEHAAHSDCLCKDQWQAELVSSPEGLRHRIERGIGILEDAFDT
jgi:radical SAM enzyme (TIGR01210 family)